MDKRFFLALFLSLVVIAITQLLFPPVKPKPSPQIGRDSTAQTASSTTATASSTAVNAVARRDSNNAAAVGSAPTLEASRIPAETTIVETPKAVYRFSNVGAAPTSVIIRDYNSRSTNSKVDLGTSGASLLGYRVLGPSDTADLARVPFTLTRSRTADGAEVVTYSAVVRSYNVAITYTIPIDPSLSYVMHVAGRV